jgi:hypothetical protein
MTSPPHEYPLQAELKIVKSQLEIAVVELKRIDAKLKDNKEDTCSTEGLRMFFKAIDVDRRSSCVHSGKN